MSLLWKKALGWMLCLVMVVGILPGVVEKTKAAETVSHIAGDANLDGQVDLSDVSCILKNYEVISTTVNGSFFWDEQQKYNTDLNYDRHNDSLDATLLGEYLVYLHDDMSEFGIRQDDAVILPSSRVTGGNDGGDNPDIRFSFVDDQQADTFTVEYGQEETLSISVKLYAGTIPISGISAQFLCSEGIVFSDNEKDLKIDRSNFFDFLSSFRNPKKLRVAACRKEPLEVNAENGEPVFTIKVTVPDTLPEGTYTVGFSDHCRVYMGYTNEIYSTAFTPYTIVVKKKQEATPEAVFTATGSDTATLTNVAAGMTYSIDGGAATEITGDTVELQILKNARFRLYSQVKAR